jgi:palmitoyltransferase
MEDDTAEERTPAKLYLTRLRIALAPYTVHFNNPGYIKDELMRMLERKVIKKTLEETRHNYELRYAAWTMNKDVFAQD